MSRKLFIPSSLVFALLLIITYSVRGQKSADNWYFGIYAGLNFSTNTPAVLNNSAMFAIEGCASISDDNGNLLFYTEGDTIWNSLHLPMANGTGLIGNSSSTQGSLIIKKPLSQTEYVLFTLDEMASAAGLHYSVVNSTLAAGLGSVTTKNSPLLTVPCSEKMTAVNHCNGSDYWVLVHAFNSANFHAYQLTATGVSTTAVVSQVGAVHTGQDWLGCMKLSPNGKKLAVCSYSVPSRVELFDFNTNTGVVSAPISFTLPFAYGCEFSPDGTKLYVTGSSGSPSLFQWDLCNTSTTAILASQFTQTVSASVGAMQLANNGKIYVASQNQQCLGVVNFPNNSGAACNYSACGQSIAPKNTYASLPNFPSSFFRQALPAFTFSNSQQGCQTYTFFSQAALLPSNCPATAYSGLQWNFGDPISNTFNTSNFSTPIHTFSDTGSFLVKAFYTYACGVDSVSAVVHVTQKMPVLGPGTNYTICSGEKIVLSANGNYSFTWSGGQTSATIAVSPTVSQVYTVVATANNGCTASVVQSVMVSACTEVETKITDKLLVISPNPLKDILMVDSHFPTPVLFTIISMSGEEVYHHIIASGQNVLSLKELPAGIYILQVEGRYCRLIKE